MLTESILRRLVLPRLSIEHNAYASLGCAGVGVVSIMGRYNKERIVFDSSETSLKDCSVSHCLQPAELQR